MTNKQKIFLKNLAKDIKPLIIGKDGFNERQYNDLKDYLTKHEVMKIKLLETSPTDIEEVISKLEEDNINIINKIGRTLIIYQENPKLKNKLELPN